MADTSKLIRYFEASGSGEEARRMLDLAEQVVKGRPYRVADFTSPAGLVIADAIKANYPQLIGLRQMVVIGRGRSVSASPL